MRNVYRFALRLARGDVHAAEDLTQETMLRAWRHRERLRDATAARTWLFHIAANAWRDEERRRGVRRAWLRRAAAHATQPPPPPPRAESEEAVGLALRALDRLPDRQREVVFLTACEGLSIEDTAAVLSIGAGAVRSSLSLARLRLRQELVPGAAVGEAPP